MRRSRLVVALSLVAGLMAGSAGCGRRPAADAAASAAGPAPGVRSDTHVQAGGVAPPALPADNARRTTATDEAAGGNLFASMNCDGCHGGGGSGWVGPSLIDGRWRYGGAADDLFSSIYFGRPKGMPAYGGVIGPDGVWMLVAYLTAQPVPAIVPTTSYEDMDRPAPAAPAAIPDQNVRPVPSTADTPDQMVARYGCIACHAVDRKVVGPSMRDVAAKYKGRPGAERLLIDKVKNGGAGTWGTIPMVPNLHVPDRDLDALLNWVLALQ